MKTIEKCFRLHNDVLIPALGFGTWQIPNEIAKRCCLDAIEQGYTHIDSAIAYGNEVGVGEAIAASKIKRENIFLTTKIPAEIKNYEDAKTCIEASLKRLNVDYIDLMLIHAPKPWPQMRTELGHRYEKENVEVYRALEEAYEAGKLRSIGVSNFNIGDIQNILDNCKVVPHVNQICVHIGYVKQDVIDFCKKNNILVEAYSPLATGNILQRPEIQEMAKKYNVTAAQLCIRFTYQLGLLPLPKTTHAERMKENAEIDFEIDQVDMEALLKL